MSLININAGILYKIRPIHLLYSNLVFTPLVWRGPRTNREFKFGLISLNSLSPRPSFTTSKLDGYYNGGIVPHNPVTSCAVSIDWWFIVYWFDYRFRFCRTGTLNMIVPHFWSDTTPVRLCTWYTLAYCLQVSEFQLEQPISKPEHYACSYSVQTWISGYYLSIWTE